MTDTVIIRYSFWAEMGAVEFAIFNNANKQIFIDWKNSAFIRNGRKLDYWTDVTRISSSTTTHTSSVTSSRSSSNRITDTRLAPDPLDWRWITRSISTQVGTGFSISDGLSYAVTEGTMVKDERITSIPPKSYVGMGRHRILSSWVDPKAYRCDTIIQPELDGSKRMVRILRAKINRENSPMQFRNFLTFSFSEDMRDPFTIDDSFWLSEIQELPFRHFRGKCVEREDYGSQKCIRYEEPYGTRTRFYWMVTR